MTRPIPAPHAAAIGVRHAGRDPDACQESEQAGCRSSPRRPDEKRLCGIIVMVLFARSARRIEPFVADEHRPVRRSADWDAHLCRSTLAIRRRRLA